MRRISGSLFLFTALLWASNSYSTCPYDGEQANFTGLRHGNDCEYRHMHADRDRGGFVEHRFWANCGD